MARRALPDSARSTVHRKKERGSHDRAVIDAILDEGVVCHVGFPDAGSTMVVPTTYARVGDQLYLHGAAANRMLRVLASGAEVCVAVTLLDGLVLARSAFHHAVNYRSVVLFGQGRPVTDPAGKRRALTAIVDHLAPGRSADARPPTDAELRATAVVCFPIVDGSAKIRSGGPVEEPEDLGLRIWAGQLPLELASGAPVADAALAADVAVPAYVKASRFRRG